MTARHMRNAVVKRSPVLSLTDVIDMDGMLHAQVAVAFTEAEIIALANIVECGRMGICGRPSALQEDVIDIVLAAAEDVKGDTE